MRKYFLWPVVVLCIWFGLKFEDYQTTGGYHNAMQGFGGYMLAFMLVESVVLYALFGVFLSLYKRWKKTSVRIIELIIVGASSMFVVFAAILFPNITDQRLANVVLYVSYPFILLPILSIDTISRLFP